MERRRLALVLAGLVLVGGAVTALRLANGTPKLSSTPTTPPPPTVIRAFTAEGVLAPMPGPHPPAPARLVLTPGPHRLQVTWGSALPGGTDPAGAVGYDVSWGTGGQFDHDRLVAEPATELDGLDPSQDVQVQVRTVDNFGQRSDPASATGRPQQDPPPGADNALADRFDGAQVPDPNLWFLASTGCAQASKGTGDDADRLVLLSECGQQPFALRARTPFTLATASTGGSPSQELGRFTVATDAPGENGEIDVDLVPGPADLIDGSPNDTPAPTAPNVAGIDGYLPPGTIRVRIIASSTTGKPVGSVQVVVGPNTPLVPPSTQAVPAIPTPRVGLTVRWDVVLRSDGIRVLRDGVDVGGGNAVPSWTQATALLEFVGTTSHQFHAGVSLVGFGGQRTAAPPLITGPPVQLIHPLAATAPSTLPAGTPGNGPGSAQLRLVAQFQARDANSSLLVNGAPPTFSVEVGGKRYPAQPAVPGQPLAPQTRYPLVAQLPPGALAPDTHGFTFVDVDMAVPSGYPGSASVQITGVDYAPGGNPGPAAKMIGPQTQIMRVPAPVAVLTGRLLDAGGQPAAPGQPMRRGRVVLDVSTDAVASAQADGSVAGLAGIEVWLDGTELAAVPTAADGPGIAGDWQIAFAVTDVPAGPHLLDVRAFGAAKGVSFGETFVNFTLGP